MDRETTTARVRHRLRRLHSDRRFSQVRVAELLGMVPSNVSRTIRDEDRPITLEFLQAVSEESQVPIGELVAPDDAIIKQLNPEEAQLLRYVREWPSTVRRALLTFLAYWADEDPSESQTRKAHAYWRSLGTDQRDWLLSVMVLLKEGSLGPDLRAGVTDHLTRERYKREADAATRPKKPT